MIVNYFELAADFTLEPADALAFFRDKGLAPTFSYLDLVGEEHNAAFTVAKMMDTDLLATVRGKLDDALANGKTLQDFKRELIPTLQSAGWWGKKDMVDPLTGRVVDAQLGSASRLENIFRTNLQSAYAAGHWEKIQEQSAAAPYLLYDAVDDHRTRADHAAMDGTILPVGSTFWDTFYPPNGYGCRCGAIQLDEDELAEYGLTVSPEPKPDMRNWTNPRTGKNYVIPAGADPQFSQNAGKWRLAKIDALAAEKAAQLAQKEAAALAAAQGAIEKARTASRIEAQAAKALKDLQKAETEGAFLKQHAKVQQRAAQYQIDDAIANKTPYLAAQIKKVASTKAGKTMTPVQLLEKAKEQGQKEKQAKALGGYKKAMLAGKEPNQDGLAAYGQLSPDEKAMLSQQIDVESGNYAAQLQIDEINQAAGGFVYAKKAIKKLDKDKALDGMSAKQQLALINQEAEVFKAAEAQAKGVTGYKKNLLAGKTPTENQIAAYNSLPVAKQLDIAEELDAQIQKAKPKPPPVAPVPDKPAPATPAATDAPDMDNLTQTGPQKGSNPGGKYMDTTTSQEWYIKTPNSLDNAKNEVLAGKLYQLAGVEAPDLAIVDYNGRPGIASKIIEGLTEDSASLRAGTVSNVGDNFAVDAWLANWDVVGLSYDNLLVKGNRAIRVDTGGALRYRAQGGLKGAAWGDTVSELDTLRDAGLNPQAASVFGNVTDDQIRAGVTRIARITDKQIDDLVGLYGPAAAPERQALAATLKARRDDLTTRYGVTKAKPAPVPATGITDGEAKRITTARQNGYAIATDKDQIEDQQILYWQETATDGTKRTHAQLKVREAGYEALTNAIEQSGAGVDIRGNLDEKILTAIKGVASVATKEGLRDKDIVRIKEALAQFAVVQKKLNQGVKDGVLGAADKKKFLAHYKGWMDYLKTIEKEPVGTTVMWAPADKGLPEIFGAGSSIVPQAKQMAFNFDRRRGKGFNLKEIRRGFVKETGKELNSPDFDYYEGTIGEATVRFWGSDAPQALRGRVEVLSDGIGAAPANTILKALKEAGINTDRPTALDAEELYLRQIAYHRRMNDDLTIATGGDQQQRIDYLKDALSADLPRRIDEMPGYQPLGTRQAFEEGFIHRYRPDLPTAEWEKFQQDHRLFHSNTGGMAMPDLIDVILNSGGKMAPTTDKMRRGVPIGGMSPEPDIRSGGAQYFFTRLRKASSSAPGFYWKAKHVARLDAISYNHDAYGRTSDGYVSANRKTGIEEWRNITSSGGNETILKDGISLFDEMDRIVAQNQQERDAIIKALQSHGYNQWPDGRELSEVITLK